MTTRRPIDRLTIGIVIGVLLLVAVGIGIVLIGPQRLTPADESTPRGVVTSYLQAIHANQPDRAYEFLSASARSSIGLAEFTHSTNFLSNDRQRIEITDSTTSGDTARVTVRYSSVGGLSVGGGENRTALLVRENGQWRISAPTEPFISRPR